MAFAYKVTLTIDHTKCGASDSTNFPVLVYISDARLKTVGNGGQIQNTGTQSGGNAVTMPFDLIFTSDSAGSTRIPWEIDYYDGTNGILWAWVKIGTVSHSVDTLFYGWFGDASVNSQQNTGSFSVANVWANGFVGVWHFPDGTTLNLKDSTSNANDGTATNVSAASGQVDGGALWGGAAGNVNIASPTNLDIGTGDFTVGGWFYVSSAHSFQEPIQFNKYGIVFSGSNLKFAINIAGTTSTATGAISLNTWYHVKMTRTGTTYKAYLNGALQSSTFSDSGYTEAGYHIGYGFGYPANNFVGEMDEISASTTVRSADWITTEYNNQNSPGTFLSISIAAAISGAPSLTLTGCGC